MSQEGVLTVNTSGSPVVETLTGNSGGPVGPDAAYNIDVLGDNLTGLNVIGVPAANTLTIYGLLASTTQQGTIKTATNAQAIAGIDPNNAITSASLAAKLGTQTAHTVALFEGSSSALSPSNIGTDGQVLIGATGADPAFATITSADGSITFTPGANSLDMEVTGGPAITNLAVDASTGPGTDPVLPDGSGTITVTGAQVAAGTIGANVIRTDSLAANTYTIEIQRSTTNATTDSTKNGVSHFDSRYFSVDSDGFVSSSGAGFVWSDQGISTTAVSNHGYFITASLALTLPASPTNGDVVAVFVDGAFTCTITGNTGQKIKVATVLSSAAGTATNTASGDAMYLVYRSTNTQWQAINFVGVWNLT